MLKYIQAVFICALASISLIGQDAKLTVEISSDTLPIGNFIQLKYTLENASGSFEMPELDGLRVVSGPNTSSSMSMINGEVTQSSSYTLYLEPFDIGTAVINPAYINTEQGRIESGPIVINVLDNPDGIKVDLRTLKMIEEIVMAGEGKSKKKRMGKKRFKI